MAAPLNSSAAARPLDPTTAAEQLAAMAAELQQRDQLIETLTERLEEAAEQLDRIHRSGGDRGARGGGGAAMPAEALEYLYSVAERTDQMVAEWTEVQAAAILTSLDTRIEKLIEVLRGDAPPEPQGYTPPSYLPDATPPAPPAVAQYHAADGAPAAADVEEEPIELKDPPALIGDEESDPAKLHDAIRQREDYITYLIRELHRRRPRQPIDWEALQSVPEEFAERLKQLEQRLQSDLQKEELSLSIERARMARERNELDKIRSRLEKEIRSLGKPGGGAAVPEASDNPKEDVTGGLRKFFTRKK